jgi:hypothetical protein
MAGAQNTFEGGSQGTTISPGNSGGASGDAFQAVTIAAGGTLTFDSGGIKGAFGARMTGDGTSANIYGEWSTIIGTQTTIWGRLYWRWNAYSTGDLPYCRLFNGANAAARLDVQGSTKFLRVRDAANLAVGTGVVAIPQNQLVRIEFKVVAGTPTSGSIEARLWLAPESGGTPNDTVLVTGIDTNSQFTVYRIGIVSSANNSTLLWDDVALSTVDWIGPSGPYAVKSFKPIPFVQNVQHRSPI